MEVLEKYTEQSKIKQESLRAVISSIIDSTEIIQSNSSSLTYENKVDLLHEIILFLERLLALDKFEKSSQNLEIIDILDKLLFRKEILENLMNNTSAEDLKVAGQRLGKKSQSAFSK